MNVPTGFGRVILIFLLFAAELVAQESNASVSGDGGEGESFSCSEIYPGDISRLASRNKNSLNMTSEIIVGALAIKGEETLLLQWNATFSEYLSHAAGARLDGRRFRMVALSFDNIYQAVRNGCVDFVFANPAVYACLAIEHNVAAVATVTTLTQGHELTKFYGSVIARADRDDISTFQDVRGKIVEAISPSGLGGYKMQAHEMMKDNVLVIQDALQLRFTGSQPRIIKDVINGDADIGFVRADMVPSLHEQGVIDMLELKVIQSKDLDPDYPFEFSTSLASPTWPLASMSHVPSDWSLVISEALLDIPRNSTAAKAGMYAKWDIAAPYYDIIELLYAMNEVNTTSGVCFNNGVLDLYDQIMCPAGTGKLSYAAAMEQCQNQELQDPRNACPDGLYCFCQPCVEFPQQEFHLHFQQDVIMNHEEHIDDSDGNEDDGDGGGDDDDDDDDDDEKAEKMPSEFNSQGGLEGISTSFVSHRCDKLQVCAVVTFRSRMRMRVMDNWFYLRDSAGLSYIKDVQYRIWNTSVAEDDIGWMPAVHESSPGMHWYFELEFNEIGNQILQLRTACSEAKWKSVSFSPVIMKVLPMVCDWPHTVPNYETMECECIPGYGMEPGGECLADYVQPVTKIVGSTAAVVFLVLVLGMAGLYRHIKKMLAADYVIEREELQLGEDHEVIGQGRFGMVVKARFRGTEVVVKRAIPPSRDPNDNSENRFSKATPCKNARRGIVAGTPLLRNLTFSNNSAESKEDSEDEMKISMPDNSLRGLAIMSMGRRKSLSVKFERIQAQWNHKVYPSEEPDSHQPPGRFNSDDIEAGMVAIKSCRPDGEDMMISTLGSGRTTLKSLAEDFMAEVKVMVHLRHPNITTIMGACSATKEGEPPLLVMEYMQHGSLYELLHNQMAVLDAGMILQFAKDIATGMTYIHSCKPPILHNDLKTANVLIDTTFRAKLSDFGLSQKRKIHGYTGTPYYMAPELLNKKPNTPASDVYAMGMVLYELFTRKDLYSGQDPVDVLTKVKNMHGDNPYRPKLPKFLPEDVASLIKDCWAQDPLERPDFQEVARRIHCWSQLKIEKYWRQAHESSEKSRRISVSEVTGLPNSKEVLHKVFPVHVAQALSEGRKVEPEHHDCVTIFFSDIVGFTDISSTLQPVDVMDMLDRLYLQFDALADKHELFKVETIGDAYMAVANLVQNQTDHAERIARFALDAVKAANSVPIKESDLSIGYVHIRAGFHSGPVVASVVGNLNPRYCLFGDTVNTASRMESTSEKDKIHCSDASAKQLHAGKAIDIQSRGLQNIKGKGAFTTYWVTGLATDDVCIDCLDGV